MNIRRKDLNTKKEFYYIKALEGSYILETPDGTIRLKGYTQGGYCPKNEKEKLILDNDVNVIKLSDINKDVMSQMIEKATYVVRDRALLIKSVPA